MIGKVETLKRFSPKREAEKKLVGKTKIEEKDGVQNVKKANIQTTKPGVLSFR